MRTRDIVFFTVGAVAIASGVTFDVIVSPGDSSSADEVAVLADAWNAQTHSEIRAALNHCETRQSSSWVEARNLSSCDDCAAASVRAYDESTRDFSDCIHRWFIDEGTPLPGAAPRQLTERERQIVLDLDEAEFSAMVHGLVALGHPSQRAPKTPPHTERKDE